MAELASAYITLIPSLRGAQQTISKELNGCDFSGVTNGISGKIGGAFKTAGKVGIGAIAAIGTAVGGLAVGGGISRALKLDQAQFKFKALGMDVAASMAACNEAVDGTAFGLDAAATVATQLGAAGVTSSSEMTGALKAVAGVAAMSGKSMEQVGSIFGKVAAKGKVTGDELLQLTDAGINGTAALAKHFGKSADEIQKMVARGEIDFAEFSEAMEATFGEAASGANETFQGAMSNVNAALSRIGAKFSSPALDGLRKVFVALIPAINAVSSALDPAVKAFTSFVEFVSGKAVSGITFFTDTLKSTGSILRTIKACVLAAFDGTPISNLSRKIVSFVADVKSGVSPITLLKSCLSSFGDYLGNVLPSVFDTIKAKISELPEPIQTVIDKISSFAQTFSDKFGGLLAPASGVVATFAVIMAKFHTPIALAVMTVSKLAPAFSGIVSVVQAVASAFMTAGGGISGLATLIGAVVSPVGIAVAAIAAMAAGFIYLMATNEGFRSSIVGLVEQIGASLAPILLIVGQAISQLATSVLPVITSLIMALVPVIGQIITVVLQIVAALAPVITMLVATLVPIITTIIELVVTTAAQIITAVLPVITMILDAIQSAMPTIQAIISAAMGIILLVIQTVWPIIQTVIETVMGIIQSVISIVTSAINGDWEGVWNGIKSLIDVVWNGIKSVIDSVLGILQGVISGALGAIKGVWDSAWNGISEALSSCWEGIKSSVSAGIDAVVGFVSGLPGQIQGFFSDAGSWLVDAGKNIIDGLLGGLKNGVDAVVSFVQTIGGTIAANKGPKAYDLALLIPNGGWIMQSLETGLEKSIPSLRRTLGGIGAVVADYQMKPITYSGASVVPYGWQSVEPIKDSFAASCGTSKKHGDITNYYLTIDGSKINTTADIRDAIYGLFDTLMRQGAM